MVEVKELIKKVTGKDGALAKNEKINFAVLSRENPNPIIQMDSSGMVLYANDASQPLLKYWQTYIDSLVPEKCRKIILDVLASGHGHESEESCEEFIWSLTWVPDVGKNTINVYGIEQGQRIRVFNDLKLAEEMLKLSRDQLEQRVKERTQELEGMQGQLMQSEKMASIGQLAAGVAHEINNPVGYINSNIGSLRKYIEEIFMVLDAYEAAEPILKNDVPAMERIAKLKEQVDLNYLKGDVIELIKESQEGIKRVKQIVQDLKDFSHVDEAEWQWADLHKGLDSTLNIVHNEIKYKAEVVKKYSALPQVECIPSQINQVFMNLLVNASHAIEKHGVITISSGVDDKDVWVTVSDTGKGMEKEIIKRIFDPFFTTKPVGKGTGLGLSLAYGIMNKHHGRIEVESEVGKGTTFRIVLPIEQEESKVKKS